MPIKKDLALSEDSLCGTTWLPSGIISITSIDGRRSDDFCASQSDIVVRICFSYREDVALT